MTVQSDKVLVYLEKGGACFDIASCKRRCAPGSAKAQLCTMAQDEGKNLEGNIWSGDKEENPGLHDSYKVFVPYCTSDVYIGRRDPDNSTAGYAFRGRNVVEAVITDLLSDFSPISITQFVFMGASAGELFCLLSPNKPPPGAFGVAATCDWVKSQVERHSPGADVRCVMDSLDFYPITLPEPPTHCRALHCVVRCSIPLIRSMATQFWNGESDESCAKENVLKENICSVFTTAHQYIETPFMVVGPYQDTNDQANISHQVIMVT